MPIDYELVQNKITDPPSFTPIVRHKGTVRLGQLIADIADASTLSAADIQATVTALIERIQIELERGNLVNIDGLARFSLSIRAKLANPTDDLPTDAKIGVNVKPARHFAESLQGSASLNRIDATNQSPNMQNLEALTGSLSLFSPKDILELSGSRLTFTLAQADEGVFFCSVDGSVEVRADTYLTQTHGRLVFAVPEGVDGTTGQYVVELRSRGRTANVLRVSMWPTPIGHP